MPPNHRRRRLRVLAALPPVPLSLALALLLLSAPLPAASGPIACPKGNTWDLRLESCRACSVCSDPRAPYVVVPCEPHRDTQCGTLSAFGIDWSFVGGGRRGHNQNHNQQQKTARRPEDGRVAGTSRARTPAGGGTASRPAVPPRPVVPATPPPPRLPEPTARRFPRPRTREEAAGVAPEMAVRLMDLEASPSGLRRQEDVFLLPEGSGSSSAAGAQVAAAGERGSPSVSEGEEGASIAEWGWRHWLAAGVSMAVVCALVLVLAPSALKGLRKRCSHPGSKGRHRDREKGQHSKIVKSDQPLTKSSQRIGDRGFGLHSSSHRVLHLEELLASGRGGQRQESKNVYVEDATGGVDKLLPPANSSVLVASISPGLVQTVRVELQDDGKNRRLSTNCLGLDCASRTVFIGRSSAV